MLHKVFFFFLVCLSTCSFSQENYRVKVVEKTALTANRFVGVDSYNDLYYIHKRSLYKKTPSNTYSFNDFQLGDIGSVDLLNPLKITIYYPDFNTVVILDNRLNEIQRVNFNLQPPFLNVAGATTANDNRLWIFNIDSQQLELYNYRTHKQQPLSLPVSETYVTHQSNFNFCYLLTENKLRMYNIYGSALASLPNNSYDNFVIDKERLLVSKDNQLILISENLSKTYFIKSPEIAIKDLYLTDDFLYLYDGEFLHKTTLTLTKN